MTSEILSVNTSARSEMIDITAQVQQVVSASGARDGLAVVYCPHTTAGLTINENADPAVVVDMLGVLDALVPWKANYRHAEGNSAAHVKASLMGATLTVVVREGRLVLGTWQGLYLCEFDGPRRREVHVTLSGVGS